MHIYVTGGVNNEARLRSTRKPWIISESHYPVGALTKLSVLFGDRN